MEHLNTFKGFAYPADQLQKFAIGADIFTISLKDGKGIIHYTPDDPKAFETWLIGHGIVNIKHHVAGHLEITNTTSLVIVDDHDKLRNGLVKILGRIGFNVLFSAENGKDFFDKITKSILLPDVCLIDLRMPIMDGYETIRQIRKRGLPVKIVAYSTDNSDLSQGLALDAGADAYYIKGRSMEELKRTIELLNTG